jgi:hypothetical protein
MYLYPLMVTWAHSLQSWATVKDDAIKMGMQLSLLYTNLHSFGYMPRSDIAETFLTIGNCPS